MIPERPGCAPPPCTRDIAGLNGYMSEDSGGPYTKVNGSLIPIPARTAQWTIAGLQPHRTYCFVLTSIDISGNEYLLCGSRRHNRVVK